MLHLFFFNEKVSENDYSTSVTGKAYKVFKFKNGKLYPPMVENPGGAGTPTGVWLDAEEGEFIELEGRKRVIQRGTKKSTVLKNLAIWNALSDEEKAKKANKGLKDKVANATLAYRPGWHLGEEPIGPQFNTRFSWEEVEPIPMNEVDGKKDSLLTLSNSIGNKDNNKIFYVKKEQVFVKVITSGKDPEYLPYDFIWAECDYIMDINYQEKAMAYGYTDNGKFQHSLAGLPEIPKGGYYKYRTNPRPETIPWVITGAIKVNKLIDDYQVDKLTSGRAPIRQGGMKTLSELGLTQI